MSNLSLTSQNQRCFSSTAMKPHKQPSLKIQILEGNPCVNKGRITNALDNEISASTVGLIYTFQLCLAPCTSFRDKKVLLFRLNISLKALKQEKKIIKVQAILIRTCLISYYHYAKDFSSECEQILSFLRIWSHLLEKSLMKNFIFCAVMTHYFQALNSSNKSRNIETFCMYLKYANTNTRYVVLHSMLKLNKCKPVIWFK